MCVCLCLCVRALVCSYIFVSPYIVVFGSQRIALRHCHLFLFLFETGSLSGLKHANWVRLAGQQAAGIHLSHLCYQRAALGQALFTWTWGSKLGPGVSVCVSELVLFEMSHGSVWDDLHQCQLHRPGVWSQRQHRRVSAKSFPNPVQSVFFNGKRNV